MIKSQITLKQLEAFVQVVDTGSFRKAAAALGTTQPNVSARIAALEKTLDVVLMHRDAGSVRLTPDGDTLVAAAREVLPPSSVGGAAVAVCWRRVAASRSRSVWDELLLSPNGGAAGSDDGSLEGDGWTSLEDRGDGLRAVGRVVIDCDGPSCEIPGPSTAV